MSQKHISLSALLPIICILAGCGSGGGYSSNYSPPTVATITVSSVPSIAVSGTEQISATAKDSGGNAISGITFNWSSSASSVATINTASGLATGLLPGATQITASANGVTSAPTTLTVTPGFLSIGPMSVARGNTTFTLLNNGKVLISGGSNTAGILGSAELYDPSTKTFTLTGSLNTPRYDHTATLLDNGKVLIAGGWSSSGILNTAELYDPSTGAFTPTGALNEGRIYDTATHLPNGMVLIAGGSDGSGTIWSSAELYDPTTGQFSLTGSLNIQRRLATATLLNDGTVLIAGGISTGGTDTSGTLSSVELYHPLTGTFTLTGSLNAARLNQTATLLNSGEVLIVGGDLPSAPINGPLSSAELYNPATGLFSTAANLNTARTRASATLLNNGTVLLAGGFGSGSSSTPITGAEVYDPVAGTFASTGSLSIPHDSQGAVLLNNGTVLFAGNYDYPTIAPAELYEPGTFAPVGLQSISISPASPTISPVAYQQYIATGTFTGGGTQQLGSVTWSTSDNTAVQISNDGTNPGAAVAIASPTSTVPVTITATLGNISGTSTLNVRSKGFVTTGSMNENRDFFQATRLFNGIVLVEDGQGSMGPTAELYNPANGTFAFAGNPVAVRNSFYTATLLQNGKVLIAGGVSTTGPLAMSSAELYDPTTGTFTATGSLNVGRYGHTATLLGNGQVLIAGGQTSASSFLSSAELYDPVSGTFTPTGNLGVARAQHTATWLLDGTVLITGGQATGGLISSSAEIFNPITRLFTSTGSLNVPRFFHTATRFMNGKVLIAGGNGGNSGNIASAELYDPLAKTFSSTGNLITGRDFHTATLLNNGMILVTGGLDHTGNPLASAELYDPATGTFSSAGNLSATRANHIAVLLCNGMVLITGGANLATSDLY